MTTLPNLGILHPTPCNLPAASSTAERHGDNRPAMPRRTVLAMSWMSGCLDIWYSSFPDPIGPSQSIKSVSLVLTALASPRPPSVRGRDALVPVCGSNPSNLDHFTQASSDFVVMVFRKLLCQFWLDSAEQEVWMRKKSHGAWTS